MAAGTTLSRITGLVRTAALAAALGYSSLGDAYNVAHTVPAMLLVLVTGGTLSAVVVPLLAREPDLEARRRRAESLGGAIFLVTGAASVVAVLASPLIARLFALGVDQGEYDDFVRVTTVWLALLAPQILLWGMSVYANALLQADGRLALTGFSPVLTNLVAIASVGIYFAVTTSGERDVGSIGTAALLVIGLGSTLSVGVMTAVQLLGARRTLPGLHLRPRVRRGDPQNRELVSLGRWTALLVVANQLGLAAVLVRAKYVEGGVIAYQNAFMVMQLPYAIIAVSLFSALYPRLSRQAANAPAEFARTASRGVRLGTLLLLPSSVGLAVLAVPVTELLLSYGEAAGQTGIVSAALRSFALALLPYTIYSLLSRGHYAMSDTRTPAIVTTVLQVVNVTAGFIAFAALEDPSDRVAGLASGYALAYVVGCLLLGRSLRRRRRGVYAGATRALATCALAAAVMAGALLGADALLPEAAGRVALAGRTLGLVVLGAAVYLSACALLRSPEVRELTDLRGLRSRG